MATVDATAAKFREMLEHLAEYHWFHDLHLTKFFQSQVWTQIPQEWDRAFQQMTVEQLNQLPFPDASLSLDSSSSQSEITLPNSLEKFLQKSLSLTLDRKHVSDLLTPTSVGKDLARGMSPKKLHEVQWMASLVHQVATQAACTMVVDIGSGLGYLGQVLHTSYGFPVIGIEGSTGHTEGAEKRAAKQGLQCSGIKSVPFEIKGDAENMHKFCDLIHETVSTVTVCEHADKMTTHACAFYSCQTENCNQTAEPSKSSCVCDIQSSACDKVVQDTRQKDKKTSVNYGTDIRVCLIGLHCCGDLTPALLRLFQQVDFIQAVCCVSCCYHKMQLIPGTNTFHNFPMSKTAEEAYTSVQHQFTAENRVSDSFFSPCSLRLAAQETRSRWVSQSAKDHEAHTRHVAFRALLELLENDKHEAADRRTVRRLDYSSWGKFVDSYLSSVDGSHEKLALEKCLQEVYTDVKPLFRHVEPFTCLQVVLQPVLETLILRDRQRWLEEDGFHGNIVPIFDEQLSPRNLALVSIKDGIFNLTH